MAPGPTRARPWRPSDRSAGAGTPRRLPLPLSGSAGDAGRGAAHRRCGGGRPVSGRRGTVVACAAAILQEELDYVHSIGGVSDAAQHDHTTVTYDPDLTLMRGLIGHARALGMEVLHFSEFYRRALAAAGG